MKLSNDTLNVLKNFASINQSIMFKKGKTLKTVSGGKNVLAEATITEEIPADFGVYNLNEFLSVLSLHKEECPGHLRKMGMAHLEKATGFDREQNWMQSLRYAELALAKLKQFKRIGLKFGFQKVSLSENWR